MKDLVVVLIGQHEGPRIALALSDQKHAESIQNRIFENSGKRRRIYIMLSRSSSSQLSIYLPLNLLLDHIDLSQSETRNNNSARLNR